VVTAPLIPSGMADAPRRQFSRGKSARVILTEEADRMRASSAGGDESLRESSVMIDENLLATCDALTDAELAPLARAYEEDKLNFAIRKLLTARGLVDGEGGAARIVQARAIDIRMPQDSEGEEGGERGSRVPALARSRFGAPRRSIPRRRWSAKTRVLR
jgi:hypothetical protein